MLRGVHKSIIEVCETENPYFEKAIFFVRPGQRDKDASFLKNKAEEYLSRASKSAEPAGQNMIQTKTKVKFSHLFQKYRLWLLAVLLTGAYLLAQYFMG